MMLLHNIQPTGDDDAQASANQGQRYTSVNQSQKGLCMDFSQSRAQNKIFFLIYCDTDSVDTVYITYIGY